VTATGEDPDDDRRERQPSAGGLHPVKRSAHDFMAAKAQL